MIYQNIVKGIFMERPNRFLAYVNVEGRQVVSHVKNTGRCRELLIPGTEVYLEYHPDALETGRKTEYSLIGVRKGERFINMDSQAPNQVAKEWLANGGFTRKTGITVSDIRREVTYGESRFDLAFLADGKPSFMEVKGVTLEIDDTAMFPDAPTERGIKHLLELERSIGEGFHAYVLFVIQMKGVQRFTPNQTTHPAFGKALAQAAAGGVRVLAYDCTVTEDQLYISDEVPIDFPIL